MSAHREKKGVGKPRRPKDSETRPADRSQLWIYLALLLVTLAIYAPVWHGGPLWDDDAHLTRIDLQPLSGLWRIWFEVGATQQYYPVVYSAFWFMHALWGDNTLGYHLVNIVLHATSAWLLVVILRRLAVPGAILAGLIFAVHPVHVESVAWMTELKNTLSGVFYLCAALAYLRFDTSRRSRAYVDALALFVCALLSKSVTATLPAALLVVFWWQRGRFEWRRDVTPLIPFFGLGLAAGLVTSWVERTRVGAEGAAFQLSILERAVVAGRALWFYLWKLVWPADLMFVYPRWTLSTSPEWLLFPAAALAAAAILWLIRGRTRAPLAAFLFFGGTLVPALGFVSVYPFLYSFVADHFQYLASIGIITLAAALLTLGGRRLLGSRMSEGSRLIAAALVIGVPLAGASFRQSRQYVDAETLYRATIAENPGAWLAHANLGWVYLAQHRPELSIAESQEALRLHPNLLQAQNNLGTALLDLNRADESVAAFRAALGLKPGDLEISRNLALALLRSGDAAQDRGDVVSAVERYLESLRLDPDNPETHHNLGSAYARLGQWSEAISQYQATLVINPTSARAMRNLSRAHYSRGIVLASAGKFVEAVEDFSNALELDPDFADARESLARARAMIK